MTQRNRQKRRKRHGKRSTRSLRVESLESRKLLAADPFQLMSSVMEQFMFDDGMFDGGYAACELGHGGTDGDVRGLSVQMESSRESRAFGYWGEPSYGSPFASPYGAIPDSQASCMGGPGDVYDLGFGGPEAMVDDAFMIDVPPAGLFGSVPISISADHLSITSGDFAFEAENLVINVGGGQDVANDTIASGMEIGDWIDMAAAELSWLLADDTVFESEDCEFEMGELPSGLDIESCIECCMDEIDEIDWESLYGEDDHVDAVGADATKVELIDGMGFGEGFTHDANDLDVFQFTLAEADTVSIFAMACSDDITLQVLDDAGEIVAEGEAIETDQASDTTLEDEWLPPDAPAPVEANLDLKAGTYFIAIASPDSTDFVDYFVDVLVGESPIVEPPGPGEDDHVDVVGADATEIELIDGMGFADGFTHDANDVDVFQFTLAEADTATVGTMSFPEDVTLQVLDDAGEILAEGEAIAYDEPSDKEVGDDCLPTDAPAPVEAKLDLEAGTYFIAIASPNSTDLVDYGVDVLVGKLPVIEPPCVEPPNETGIEPGDQLGSEETVDLGGWLELLAGNLVVQGGPVSITADDITITAGNSTFSAENLDVTIGDGADVNADEPVITHDALMATNWDRGPDAVDNLFAEFGLLEDDALFELGCF